MTDTVFDIALEKRFTDAPEIATIDVTSADTLLIRDTTSGAVMRVPFSTLASAIATAFASSFASLDGSGKVPASQLPSYVDDVLEYANVSAFPAIGESGKIYVSAATGLCYRWTGSIYAEISSSPGSTDAVSEGSINKYFTDARARAAVSASGSLSYNPTTGVFSFTDAVTSVAGKTGAVTLAKADVGLGSVDNTSDANKPVSTAQATAIGAKANKAGDDFTGQVNAKYDTPVIASWTTNATTYHGFEWKQGTSIDAFFKQKAQTGELQLNIGRGVSWGGHWTCYIDTVKIFEARPTTFTFQDGVKLGLGVTPSQLLDVNEDSIRVRTAKTPASATATGNAGQIAWDANYIYVCTAVNTWKRSQLLTW